MAGGKQSRQGQTERRQKIIDYIRENGPVKSGTICKALGLARSSLSDDINAINSVSSIINCPKKGWYVCSEGAVSAPSIRGMLDAEHIRRWMILYLLSYKAQEFEEIKESLNEIGLACSDSTLHSSLHSLKEQHMVSSDRLSNTEVYRAVQTICPASEKEILAFRKKTKDNSAYSRIFFEPYNAVEKKAARICPDYPDTDRSKKTTMSSGKRNVLSEEQLEQLSDLELYDFRNYALSLSFRTSKGFRKSEEIRIGLIVYSVETSRIYLIGKNTDDYYTVIPLDAIDFRSISVCKENDPPIINNIYNSHEFTAMKREMLNISTDKAQDVEVHFLRLRSIEDRLKRFETVRLLDKNPAKLELNEDGTELVYTDRIRGLDDFARFIRRFGRAALVKSPPVLCGKLMQSSQKIIELYDEDSENE